MRSRALYLTSLLATIFLVLLLAATLATRGTKAALGTLYVSTSGSDTNDCSTIALACRTVQRAIDVADPLDEIQVAEGTYTDPAYTVAEITETITLQGGWNADFSARNPTLYPTTLDAQGLGRVIQIQGTYPNISPTIDGFIITGGNATNESIGPGQGGGIYSEYAHPIIVNNIITDNVASTDAILAGSGGGLYLFQDPVSALISGNQILSNTASTAASGSGGGLFLYQSPATVSGNTINNNTASTAYSGQGGGLYLKFSDATLSGNTISNNTASTGSVGHGGGLYLYSSNATLIGNAINNNTATYGGGASLLYSQAAFDSNRIISNTAPGNGGGLCVSGSAPFTLTNNIIAQNEANGLAGGIFFSGAIDFPTTGALINNTIAQNKGGGGQGVYASGTTTLTLTNNIVVSHTYGIYVDGSATVTADYTLFFGNTSGDTWGPTTSTHEVSGDPLFVNPSAWDYHIQSASPAINKGTFTGAPSTDFEGDPRPYDCFIDIGADENPASDYCQRIYHPLILKNY